MANIPKILEAAQLLNPNADPESLHLAGADHDVIYLPDPGMSDPTQIPNEVVERLENLGAHWSNSSYCWCMYA